MTHSEIAAHEDKDAAASSRLGVDCGDGVLDLLHGEVLEESRCLRREEMAPSMGLHVVRCRRYQELVHNVVLALDLVVLERQHGVILLFMQDKIPN